MASSVKGCGNRSWWKLLIWDWLIPTVKKVTMSFPMKTLFWIEKLQIFKGKAINLNRHFFPCMKINTAKLTTDTMHCDDILVNQINDSVLKAVQSWIKKRTLPTNYVESRQCEGLLGYVNQFKICLLTKKRKLFVANANTQLKRFATS